MCACVLHMFHMHMHMCACVLHMFHMHMHMFLKQSELGVEVGSASCGLGFRV